MAYFIAQSLIKQNKKPNNATKRRDFYNSQEKIAKALFFNA